MQTFNRNNNSNTENSNHFIRQKILQSKTLNMTLLQYKKLTQNKYSNFNYCNLFPIPDSIISIEYISNKNFQTIKNYIYENKPLIIELVTNLREYLFKIKTSTKIIDTDFDYIKNIYNINCNILKTNGDGNCLYNAISLILCGNESLFSYIKLSMVFILFEYEDFFKLMFKTFCYNETFKQLVIQSSTLIEYAHEYNITALSLLFLRPIYVYTSTYSFFTNPSNSTKLPIYLALHNVHFSPIILLNNYSILSLPTHNYLSNLDYKIILKNY